MITTTHLFDEIKEIEQLIKEEKDSYKKATLKLQVLQLKMLHGLRTNSTRIMKHFNIEMVKSNKSHTENVVDDE